MLAQDPLYISPEDYLAGETVSPIKHEYRDGELLAMTGGTRAHNIITGNLFGNLWTQLRGAGCRAFVENMKVQVRSANAFYYPDVVVTCHPQDQDRPLEEHVIEHPRLIIEVLSPSTMSFDRTHKFSDYRSLESLKEYVLVGSDRPELEIFRRDEAGKWSQQIYREGDGGEVLVNFESVGVAIALEDVYEETGMMAG